MSYNRGGFHPHIGSIIHARDNIHNTLYIQKNYVEAVLQMEGLFSLLKTDDYKEELRSEIEKEYETLMAKKSRNQLDNRIKSRRKTYRQWFREINAILWEKGYLDNKKYGTVLDQDEVKFP